MSTPVSFPPLSETFSSFGTRPDSVHQNARENDAGSLSWSTGADNLSQSCTSERQVSHVQLTAPEGCWVTLQDHGAQGARARNAKCALPCRAEPAARGSGGPGVGGLRSPRPRVQCTRPRILTPEEATVRRWRWPKPGLRGWRGAVFPPASGTFCHTSSLSSAPAPETCQRLCRQSRSSVHLCP